MKIFIRRNLFIFIMILLLVAAVVATCFFLWSSDNEGVYAKRKSSHRVYIEGERYLHALYLGDINDKHYYTMMTSNERDDQKTTTHLICIDNQATLIFHEIIEGGCTFGTKIINERIYMTVIEERDGETISFAANEYDLSGNSVNSTPTEKMAGTYLSLNNEIFAVYSDDYLSDNNLYLHSYITSLDGHVNIDSRIEGEIRAVHSLPDGTAIVLSDAGFIGDSGNGLVTPIGLNIYRISVNGIIWEATIPELWFFTGGVSPYAVIGNSIVFSTVGSGIIDGPGYLVDFDGNINNLNGFYQGLKSSHENYKYQRSAFFSVGDTIDILLWHYRYINAGKNDQIKDYMLRLDQNGDFISRKRLSFTDRRNVVWISLDDDGNKRYFTVYPSSGSVDFEIFV